MKWLRINWRCWLIAGAAAMLSLLYSPPAGSAAPSASSSPTSKATSTTSARPSPDPWRFEGMDVRRAIEYSKVGDRKLLLDLYRPLGRKGPLPVLLWIHGGGWYKGDRSHCLALPLVYDGYAVVSIDYRFSQEAIYPAQIEDCRDAVRWLRSNATRYNLDPNHIGAWGDSAGGHLVALLGTQSDCRQLSPGSDGQVSCSVQAVCDWFGPTDLLSLSHQAIPRVVTMITNLLGGPADDYPDRARQASPLSHVSGTAAPFLIMHGDQDPLVPLSQSETLRDALNKAGVEATLRVLEGAGHGFSPEPDARFLRPVKAFFEKHLRAAAVSPTTSATER